MVFVSTLPFTQKTYPLGAEQNFDGDKALASSDSIEDEELIQKLSQGRDTGPRAPESV
jgi:hypothetical protein